MKKAYYVFAVLTLLLLLLFSFENYSRWYRYGAGGGMMSGSMGRVMENMMQGSGMMGAGIFGLGWSFPLFLLFLTVFAAYLLTKKEEPAKNDAAAAILRERYARGEITRDEYLQMFKDLKEKK